MKYEQQLIDIISRAKQLPTLAPDQELIASGILDSFDIITLVASIEERFSILVDGEDINATTFGTARAIAALLESYEAGK